MATNNFSGFDDTTQQFFWNGNSVTADRYRYELTRQQETVLRQVNDLATREAALAVKPGANFDQQQYGGLLRTVVPQLLDKYGKVNATAAIAFYNETQLAWLQSNPEAYQQAGRKNVTKRASRYALAKTQGVMALQQGYAAQYADTYNTLAKTDAVVNFSMKVRATSGHAASVEAMNNALTREVAMYHRDTVLFNSALDPNVKRIQRVAQPSACDFCRLMALGSTRGKVRVSTYAARFHAHCHCTIQPLFGDEKPIRPDYYDQFEDEYAEASKSGGSAKTILANMRNNAKKAKAAVTPVKVPKAAVATKTAAEVPVVPVGPYNASQVASRVVSATAPATKAGWWWTKEYKATKTKSELISGHNNEIIFLRKGLDTTGTDRHLARTLPLREAREDLKVLAKPDTLEEALKNTNPLYDVTKSAYSSNCARVISAYELRRRGFNVEASKYVAKDASQAQLIYGRMWKNPTTGKTAFDELEDRGTKLPDGSWSNRSYSGKTTYEDYLQRLADTYEPGARGIVQVEWARARAGHVFNFEIDPTGKAVLVDAQTGKFGEELRNYFDKGVLWKTARLDDKEPMAGVLQYLKGFQ